MMHTRCLRWAATGGLLGSSAAWAQTPVLPDAVSVAASDPMLAVLVELARVSPLAGILAWIAFSAARWQPTIRVVLVEDESSVNERLAELERRLKDRE